jgi:hypothetical protein
MSADFPEWAARQLLAEALRAAGLPVVAGAMWRAPRDAMTMQQRLQAIDVEGRVLEEARRRLPWGVSSAALAGEFRSMVWRCVVAGMALLDVQARGRLASRGGDKPERRPAWGEPSAPGPASPLLIRRRGEAANAAS